MERRFKDWLKVNNKLADSSCDKYANAINTISLEMKEQGVISVDLYSVHSSIEFQTIHTAILENENFIEKNRRGNNMYSCALEHYSNYLKAEESTD